jgi:hypothetical protein
VTIFTRFKKKENKISQLTNYKLKIKEKNIVKPDIIWWQQSYWQDCFATIVENSIAELESMYCNNWYLEYCRCMFQLYESNSNNLVTIFFYPGHLKKKSISRKVAIFDGGCNYLKHLCLRTIIVKFGFKWFISWCANRHIQITYIYMNSVHVINVHRVSLYLEDDKSWLNLLYKTKCFYLFNKKVT